MKNFVQCRFIFVLIFVFCIPDSSEHGMLMDPVNRGSAWRRGFNTPINYDDNQNYCGGFTIHHGKNKGKCGVCGDNYLLKQPRPNENGGKYGKGRIVKTYNEGQKFVATVTVSVNHYGYFKFSLCPLKTPHSIETEHCFKKHPVLTTHGKDKFFIKKSDGIGRREYQVGLVLPKGITCKHCTLRWHWRAANNWGVCKNGGSRVGCGPQETFRTCSDIAIINNSSKYEKYDKYNKYYKTRKNMKNRKFKFL